MQSLYSVDLVLKYDICIILSLPVRFFNLM